MIHFNTFDEMLRFLMLVAGPCSVIVSQHRYTVTDPKKPTVRHGMACLDGVCPLL
jgi:hypothetical protein